MKEVIAKLKKNNKAIFRDFVKGENFTVDTKKRIVIIRIKDCLNMTPTQIIYEYDSGFLMKVPINSDLD